MLLLSSTVFAKFDYTKITGGLYTKYPLTTGIDLTYDLQNDTFFNLQYGIAPEGYMTQMGGILENWDWWDPFFTNLIEALLTGMKGYTFSFGKNGFRNHPNCFIKFGAAFYNLDYNSLTNELLEDVLGVTFPDISREVSARGNLAALSVSVGRRFQLKKNWELTTSVNLHKIMSVYVVTESETIINDSLSYELSKWFNENLEGLYLPTFTAAIKYKF